MLNRSRLWLVALLLACVTGLGTHQLLASRPGATGTADPYGNAATLTADDASGAALPGEADGAALAAGGGKGCGDCPRTIGLKCRRVSCSPCCYECPDPEFPYCTE